MGQKITLDVSFYYVENCKSLKICLLGMNAIFGLNTVEIDPRFFGLLHLCFILLTFAIKKQENHILCL